MPIGSAAYERTDRRLAMVSSRLMEPLSEGLGSCMLFSGVIFVAFVVQDRRIRAISAADNKYARDALKFIILFIIYSASKEKGLHRAGRGKTSGVIKG